jgi:hypothetical protein
MCLTVCIIGLYILYYILAYIQHNGNVSFENHTAASHRESRGSDPGVRTGCTYLYFSPHFLTIIVRSHLQILGRKGVT